MTENDKILSNFAAERKSPLEMVVEVERGSWGGGSPIEVLRAQATLQLSLLISS